LHRQVSFRAGGIAQLRGGIVLFSIPSYSLLAALVAWAFVTDARSTRIPNYLTACGTAAGLLLNLIAGGWSGLLAAFAGFACGFGILFVLYMLGAVGAGDVKLFGAIGAISGGEFVLNGIMYSILYAGGIGVVILLLRREFMHGIKRVYSALFGFFLLRHFKNLGYVKQADSLRFPFMYAVVPGVITAGYYISHV
jgi:prepilin peptidase CpaA